MCAVYILICFIHTVNIYEHVHSTRLQANPVCRRTFAHGIHILIIHLCVLPLLSVFTFRKGTHKNHYMYAYALRYMRIYMYGVTVKTGSMHNALQHPKCSPFMKGNTQYRYNILMTTIYLSVLCVFRYVIITKIQIMIKV
jgi:hypothetical protein